jgi:hypothetical protein
MSKFGSPRSGAGIVSTRVSAFELNHPGRTIAETIKAVMTTSAVSVLTATPEKFLITSGPPVSE